MGADRIRRGDCVRLIWIYGSSTRGSSGGKGIVRFVPGGRTGVSITGTSWYQAHDLNLRVGLGVIKAHKKEVEGFAASSSTPSTSLLKVNN